MRKYILALACLAVLALLVPGCFPTRGDLLIEKQARQAADEQTRSTEQTIAAEQQRLDRLRITRQQDQRDLIKQLEAKHKELLHQFQGMQADLKNCQQEFNDQMRPKP